MKPWEWGRTATGGRWHLVDAWEPRPGWTNCGPGRALVETVLVGDLAGMPCSRCVGRLRGHVEWWAGMLARVERVAGTTR